MTKHTVTTKRTKLDNSIVYRMYEIEDLEAIMDKHIVTGLQINDLHFDNLYPLLIFNGLQFLVFENCSFENLNGVDTFLDLQKLTFINCNIKFMTKPRNIVKMLQEFHAKGSETNIYLGKLI